MPRITRRSFVKVAGGAAAVGLTGTISTTNAAGKGHVVVVGGGYAGAIAAKYIRMMDSNVKVTLIEKNKHYYSCPLSNWVIADFRTLEAQKHNYSALSSNHGITVVYEAVTKVDAKGKKVTTDKGTTLSYDRLILAPGVSFKPIEGYDPNDMNVPHAWKAGPQTEAMHKQLLAMRDGGTVVITAPSNPFRCPPGPYERASLIAHYLKKNKPKSKLIILDPKPKFSKFGLFTGAWKQLYGFESDNAIIEWVPNTPITKVDAKTLTVSTEMDDIKADVLNVIPNQKAGVVAEAAGTTDKSGWAPVDMRTWESKLQKDIYIVGDSSGQKGLPKSGYAANSEAKVCAAAVVASLNGKPSPDPAFTNTCYSLLNPDWGISVAAVYKYEGGPKVEKLAGGLSPKDASPAFRKQDALYAESWYQSIMADMFT